MTSINLSILTAMIDDRWMGADDCAVFFGLMSNGKPNRRAFYERVANQPGFPPSLFIGSERKWRKSEVDLWSRDQRVAQQLEPPHTRQHKYGKQTQGKKHAANQDNARSVA